MEKTKFRPQPARRRVKGLAAQPKTESQKLHAATQEANSETVSPGRRRLPLLLRRAWYGLNQAFRRHSAQAGITPDQFTVLRTLLEHQPGALTQSELAERMSSDPNTVTSLLKRMQQDGLIRRQVDRDDRRARRVQVTASGREKYTQASPRAVALQASILATLPEPRREDFLRELEIVANACQQAQKGWPRKRAASGPYLTAH
jgi:MarR family transcriptional regulator, organic hydroperoxide resistance regulator